MKRLSKILLIVIAVLLGIFAVLYYFRSYGISSIGGKVQFYQNGIITSSNSLNYEQDVKKVVMYKDIQQLYNYPSGYSVKIPNQMNIDLRYSPAFVRISDNNLNIKVSREYSPYSNLDAPLTTYIKGLFTNPKQSLVNIISYSKGYLNKVFPFVQYEDSGMEMYFSDYLNRFILNPDYQKTNSIKIIKDEWTTINGYKTKVVSFTRTPAPGSQETQNDYLFAYMITGKRQFYSFLFRTDSLENQTTAINNILKSFKKIPSRGINIYNIDFKPILPNWNQETLNYYNKLKNSTEIIWGFFNPYAMEDYSKISQVEEKIDYKFPILLDYINIGIPFEPFPKKGAQTAYKRGQIIELTMQVAFLGNNNNAKHNANFDLLDGKYDEQIRNFARDAKEFGHPFLFRLNNEMNTDWCQYSGVLLLSDPDMYIKIWQKIYNLFQEEGVDNAIWIFNPDGANHPPTNWNSHASYYPGNEYVHMLGITGYNTGTYFNKVTGEIWRSFDEIYSSMANEYRKLYSQFPWIITEFACSSIGGNKEQWIKDMFIDLKKYPEIKAAVWWSYTDFDTAPGKTDIPARRYWLEEKEEYLKAFKEGIHKKQKAF